MNKPADGSRSGDRTQRSQQPRYQKVRELRHSPQGDRITYLAKDNATQRPVVIKQLTFSQGNDEWAGIDAYADECRALRSLNHPNIPRYLNFLPAKGGFCTVREYKKAKSLAECEKIALEQWQTLTQSLLETLFYLQDRTPSIVHRNIKPENILIDDQFNAYLVDFGFPYIDSRGKTKPSTAGMPGFMPREQLQNKELTDASDLYGLGASLICLLTQTPSAEISKFVGAASDLELTSVLPSEASFELVDWLEKMTQVSPFRRYKSATAALEAFQQTEMTRSPEAIVKPDTLELQAAEYGEILSTAVTIRNTVPDTVLQGRWEVAPHASDAKRSHPIKWIAFDPPQFESNEIECQIKIDTRKLLPEQLYERELILRANDAQDSHAIALRVNTPPLLNEKLPLIPLLGTAGIALLAGLFCSFLLGNVEEGVAAFLYFVLMVGVAIGAVGGMGGIFGLWSVLGGSFPASLLLPRLLLGRSLRWLLYLGFLLGLVVFSVAGYVARFQFGKELPQGLSGLLSPNSLLMALIATFSLSLGLLLNGGIFNVGVLLGTGIPMGLLLAMKISKQAQKMATYQKSKAYLVQP